MLRMDSRVNISVTLIRSFDINKRKPLPCEPHKALPETSRHIGYFQHGPTDSKGPQYLDFNTCEAALVDTTMVPILGLTWR